METGNPPDSQRANGGLNGPLAGLGCGGYPTHEIWIVGLSGED